MTIQYAKQSDGRETIEAILAEAPAVFVRAINKSRVDELGLEPVHTRGRPNSVGSESQLEANKFALIQEKLQLLREQADQILND